MVVSNRNFLFQGSIFRCYVSFRECKSLICSFVFWVWSFFKHHELTCLISNNHNSGTMLLVETNNSSAKIPIIPHLCILLPGLNCTKDVQWKICLIGEKKCTGGIKDATWSRHVNANVWSDHHARHVLFERTCYREKKPWRSWWP